MRVKPLLLGSIACGLALAGCGGGGPPDVTVVMTDFEFEPKQFTQPPGQRVMFVLQNKGSTEHNLSIPELKVSQNVAPGQTAKVEVAGPARVYKLFCAIDGHQEQGMVGELRIQRR